MSEDELVEALADGGLDRKSREDLYRMAQERDIAGRSEMSKDELKRALS